MAASKILKQLRHTCRISHFFFKIWVLKTGCLLEIQDLASQIFEALGTQSQTNCCNHTQKETGADKISTYPP